IVKTTPAELQRARQWWRDLELQWKLAYNEAVFGVGPTVEPPHDDHLMLLLLQIDTLRFAGPGAENANVTTPLTNLSGLIPLYHLSYLSVTFMHLTGLTELARHTRLQHLFVYNNQLASLKGIEQATGLVNLYAQCNKLRDVEPIRRLVQLETIYVNYNELTSLGGITQKHEEKLRRFYALPNDDIRDREILRVQNEIGIICRKA
ncbi:MAG: leucine-rich repeat domain-containing protein, partial [Bacteroidota bacterium]